MNVSIKRHLSLTLLVLKELKISKTCHIWWRAISVVLVLVTFIYIFFVISIFLTTVNVLMWCANESFQVLKQFFLVWSDVKQASVVKTMSPFSGIATILKRRCLAFMRAVNTAHVISYYHQRKTCSLLLYSRNIFLNIAYLHIILL